MRFFFINIDKMFSKIKTKDKKIIEKKILFLDRHLKTRYIKNRFNVHFFLKVHFLYFWPGKAAGETPNTYQWPGKATGETPNTYNQPYNTLEKLQKKLLARTLIYQNVGPLFKTEDPNTNSSHDPNSTKIGVHKVLTLYLFPANFGIDPSRRT